MTDPVNALVASRRALERLPDVLDALAGDLDPAIARTRPRTDEWAPVEILCHLRDEETEDFGARLRAVVNREATFTPIDPGELVEARRYRDADTREILEALRVRRRASVEYLTGSTLSASSRDPPRQAGTSLRLDLLVAWVAHDRLHLAQLASTLARLWGRTAGRSRKQSTRGPFPIPSAEAKPGQPQGRARGGATVRISGTRSSG